MKVTDNKELAQVYGNRIRDFMTGKRAMKAIEYPPRNMEIHLSDLQNCPLPAFYRMILPPEELPEIDLDSALRFFRGRVFERAIGGELAPQELDGIICSIDDEPIMGGVPEIKSTAKGSGFFNIEKEQPDWLERLQGYCRVYQLNIGHIIVFFLAGNMSDWLPWSIKRNAGKPEKYRGIDLKAWTFTFEPYEITENWNEMVRRGGLLENAAKYFTPENPEPIPLDEVDARRPKWQCGYCNFADRCYAKTKK